MSGFGDPGAVAAQGALLTGAGSAVDSSVDAMTSSVRTLIGDAGWSGAAASRFASTWDADAQTARSMSTAFDLAGTALTSLGATLATLRSRAAGLAEQAARDGVPLGPDGSLLAAAATAAQQAAYVRYTEDRALLLGQADAARSTAREALERALAALLLQRSLRADGPDPAQRSALDAAEAGGDYTAFNAGLAAMTPSQVQAFIASLSAAEQQALARHDAAGIGNLDGVPLPLRATADHLLVAQDLAAARATGDRHRIDVDTTLLDSGGAVVLFDPAADHYGVLFGQASAAHVGVFVPGVGDDSSLPGWIGDAKRLQQAAPGSAVIMWKGYDDPGDHGMLDKVTAADASRAQAGGHGLAHFGLGLGLAPQQTLTVVGHSYGSLVTGEALAHDGLAPTNVVLLGSPGAGVTDVSGLHLRPDQFYDEKAPGDPVADYLGGFGTDPSSPDFGGTRLATNADGAPDVSGHSQYFAADSQALTGIADVLENHVPGSDVQHPTLGDDLRDPISTSVQNAIPGAVPVHILSEHYHGPGAGVLQDADHVYNALGRQAGTIGGNVVDGGVSVVHTVTSWIP